VARTSPTATAIRRRPEQQNASTLLANPHPLLIRTSLALAVTVGFSLGLYLIVGFAFGLPLSASTPVLIQVHGQVQALGFVALFIMAVGAQLSHASTPRALIDPGWCRSAAWRWQPGCWFGVDATDRASEPHPKCGSAHQQSPRTGRHRTRDPRIRARHPR